MASIVIAAGGSGGHIFPGISLAQALKKHAPFTDIIFWGNKNSMESRIIPEYKYKLKTVSIGRLNHNVKTSERLWTLVQLPLAFLKAFLFLLFNRPKCVIGMGGHASAPLLLAAFFLRIETYIWEPNAYPGLANRYLSKIVSRCLTVFDEAKKYFPPHKSQSAGMLIRSEIDQLLEVEKDFNAREKINIFVFGGSQGAHGINKLVLETLMKYPELLEKINVFHQTGTREFDSIKLKYQEKGLDVQVSAFVDDMFERYKWADFSICRGGVNSLMELSAAGIPALIIPLPTAANNHQEKNAQALVDIEAAYLGRQSELNSEKLLNLIVEITKNRSILQQYSKNIRTLYKPGYSAELAQHLLE